MKPQQWEYTEVNVINVRKYDYMTPLQQLGREGWEICGSVGFDMNGGTIKQTLLLKRPVYPSALPPPPKG